MCKILNREKSLYKLLPVVLIIFCWYEIEMGAGYENLFQCLSMKKIYILLNIVTLAVNIFFEFNNYEEMDIRYNFFFYVRTFIGN